MGAKLTIAPVVANKNGIPKLSRRKAKLTLTVRGMPFYWIEYTDVRNLREVLKEWASHWDSATRHCQIKFATLDSVYHVTLPVYPVI